MSLLDFLSLTKEIEKNIGTEREVELIREYAELIKKEKENYVRFKSNQAGKEGLFDYIENKILNLSNSSQSDSFQGGGDYSNQRIFELFKKWYSEYSKEFKINQECINIVESIIEFYINSNFEELNKVINTKVDDNFKLFQNHIKNRLRIRFAKILSDFENSSKFQELSFLKKILVRKKIDSILRDLGDYKFKIKEIENLVK